MSTVLFGCKNTDKNTVSQPEEDMKAKKMLQGIWINDDNGTVVMKVKGDSIIYADTTLTSVTFAIYGDTLVTKSLNEAHYPIIKQTDHIFKFANASGDAIYLVKSDNPDDASIFNNQHKTVQLNQGKVIKHDSVLHVGEKHIHAYVQVNPSTYKVITQGVNESGLQCDNVYYDNLIHIAVFDGARRIFSRNIVKQDFAKLVPVSFLKHSVLSDIIIDKADKDGVCFTASVLQPDSQTSYVIVLTVSMKGKLTKKLSN